jgi:hypothetical protein
MKLDLVVSMRIFDEPAFKSAMQYRRLVPGAKMETILQNAEAL